MPRSGRVGRSASGVGAALLLASAVATASPAGPTAASRAMSVDAGAPQLVVQAGHNPKVAEGAEFTRDGRNVVTYNGGAMIVWDRAGAEIRRIATTGQFMFIALSASMVLAGDFRTKSVDVYRLDTGALVRTFAPESSPITSGAFLDEDTIALLAEDTVTISSVSSGASIRSFKCTDAVSDYLAVSRDGHMLATYGGGQGRRTLVDRGFEFNDKTVRLWDPKTGEKIGTLSGHADLVWDVAFSPDGKLLASASIDGSIRIWDLASRRTVRELKPYSGMPDAKMFPLPIMLGVDFAPDGRSVVSCSHGGTRWWFLRVWDLESGRAEMLAERKNFYSGSIQYSPDGRELLVCGNIGEVANAFTVDVATKDVATQFLGNAMAFGNLEFTRDGSGLVAVSRFSSYDTPSTTERVAAASAWSLESGEERRYAYALREHEIATLTLSKDMSTYAVASSLRDGEGKLVDQSLHVFDAQTARELWSVAGSDRAVFSPDEQVLVARDEDAKRIAFYEARTGKLIRTLELGGRVRYLAFSADSAHVAIGTSKASSNVIRQLNSTAITIFDVRSGAKTSELALERNRWLGAFAFSPDGKALLTSGEFEMRSGDAGDYLFPRLDGYVRLFDVATGREAKKLLPRSHPSYVCALSPDGKLLLVDSPDATFRMDLVDVSDGTVVRTLSGHHDVVASACFSPDGRLVASSSYDGTVRLWSVSTGEELCQLIALAGGSWLVVRSDGRFDSNDLETGTSLHWVLPGNPMEAVPFELFMREYYEPRLLPRLLAGEVFPPIRTVAERSRLRPNVTIKRVFRESDRSDAVSVVVEVESTRGAGPSAAESGVYDLKLFRDGQLVGVAPAAGGAVRVDAASGRAAITFPNVRLRQNVGADSVTFSAYAFNSDGVKSATDVKTARVPADPTPRRGRAYVVAVGVGASESGNWSLKFPAGDARAFGAGAAKALADAGAYEDVASVVLTSDADGTSATKANIRAVFDLLAGRAVDPAAVKQIPGGERLRPATPNDLVLVSFSCHGYRADTGQYYLVPYDVGADARVENGKVPDAVLARCVSSEELSTWLRDVDAGEMGLVIDACNSGAFAGEAFKPGPMGVRGLGQMAYDKGMRVLASTQGDNVARGSGLLKSGLLLYALRVDGLEKGHADDRPKDGRITLGEWFGYARARVPQVYTMVRDAAATGAVPDELRPLVETRANDEASEGTRAEERVQVPALFDFVRRRADVTIAVLH